MAISRLTRAPLIGALFVALAAGGCVSTSDDAVPDLDEGSSQAGADGGAPDDGDRGGEDPGGPTDKGGTAGDGRVAGDGDAAGDGGDAPAADGDAAPAGDGDGDGDGDASGNAGNGEGGSAGDGGGDGDAAGDGDMTAGIDDLRCEIGVADAITGLTFARFPEGGTIPLIGSGQAELLIELALLVYQADRPTIEVVVETDADGRTSTFSSVAEEGFECDPSMWCMLVPVLIDTTPLADDPFDLKELPVTVTLTVSDGDVPFCQTSLSAPLLRADS